MAGMDKSSKMVWGGVGLVTLIALAYALAPAEKPKPRSKASAARAPAPAKGRADDVFTPADETARFDRLSTTAKNGFRPVIARRTLGRGSGANIAPNVVPNDYADGEPGWTYTGTASIDSVPSALLENKQKNEALYVTVGETWRKSKVQSITSTTVTLVNEAGKRHTLDLLGDPPDAGKGALNTRMSASANSSLAATTPFAIPGMGALPGMPGGAGPTATGAAAVTVTPMAAPAPAPREGRRGRRGGEPDPSANQPQVGPDGLPLTPNDTNP